MKEELQTEWVCSWIFTGDDTFQAFKEFLEKPNENNFANQYRLCDHHQCYIYSTAKKRTAMVSMEEGRLA